MDVNQAILQVGNELKLFRNKIWGRRTADRPVSAEQDRPPPAPVRAPEPPQADLSPTAPSAAGAPRDEPAELLEAERPAGDGLTAVPDTIAERDTDFAPPAAAMAPDIGDDDIGDDDIGDDDLGDDDLGDDGAALPHAEPAAAVAESPAAVLFDQGEAAAPGQPSDAGTEPARDAAAERAAADALLAEAETARQAGDHDEALRLWAAARAHHPELPPAFQRAAALLQELGRLDEAAAILDEAHAECPDHLGLAADRAWLAHRRRRWDEALTCWADLRTAFPDHASGYVGASVTLRDTQRFDEAEAVLQAAREHGVEDDGVARERGWVAHARRDWPEAEHRWEALRERFPDEITGYVMGAVAQREQGRLEEAEAVLADAVERFPDNAWPASEHAWTANRRKDWVEAIARWRQVRERFPNHCAWGGAAALRENGDLDAAETLLQELVARHPNDFGALMEFAVVAEQDRDWAAAEQRWAALGSRFPHDATAYGRRAAALCKLGRHAEADALLENGITRLPGNVYLLQSYAQIATDLQAWPEAARRWAPVRASSSPYAGYAPAVYALRSAGRLDEADALLAEGTERFADDFALAAEFAWCAHRREDWAEAARRWRMLQAKFPEQAAAGLAASLRQAGDLDAAEETLQAAVEDYPSQSNFIEFAQVANFKGDFVDATRRWALVRDHYPDAPAGYIGGAEALSRCGQYDDADILLRELIAKMPDNRAAYVEYAHVAHRRRDLGEAARRWEDVHRRFPDTTESEYVMHAAVLREARRYDEAEASLKQASGYFLNRRSILGELAWLAHARQDFSEATARWNEFRSHFPADADGFLGALQPLLMIRRLDDAETLLKSGVNILPRDARIWTEYARLARMRGDWQAVADRWEAVRDLQPDLVEAYYDGARSLIELGRDDDADALLAAALVRFPTDAEIASQYSNLALSRGQWEEANKRFRTLREKFPDDPAGYLGGAAALRRLHRLWEAGRLIADGLARAPTNSALLIEREIEGAKEAIVQSPDSEAAYRDAIKLLVSANRLADAETLAACAIEHLPRSVGLAMDYAAIAQDRLDLPETVTRYRRITESFPDQMSGYVGLARALSCQGYHNEGEAILLGAMDRFPSTLSPFTEYAEVAMRRQEWPEALRRWKAVQQRFPTADHLSAKAFEAQMRVAEADYDIGDDSTSLEEAKGSAAGPEDYRALVLQFVSLGGTGYGCEFGLVQRHFGAEPLDLLRWTNLEPGVLTDLLRSRFEGVGASENTEVFVQRDDPGQEYQAADRRYRMTMHCFASAADIPFDEMLRRVCKRLTFLQVKTIEDLESGEKIFVYRNATRNLDDDELNELCEAVRSYGNNTLLYVRYSNESHGDGTVHSPRSGLIIGYMDRFAITPSFERLALPVQSWLEVCRNAFVLRSE
ncbi:MAG TPA: tetratricopeptide repeat protein [Acetobacteraceae bacterium]|nr:tetratricopeptide repeat protein [Acetobacteraceae bacterium]